MKASYQMRLINWLAKVTNDPIHQSARPDLFIGVGRYKDCRDRMSASMRCLWSATPVIAGIWTSAIKQAVSMRRGDGPISRSCMTGHLGLAGDGWLKPHNVTPGEEYLPQYALNLLLGKGRVVPKLDENGNPLSRRLEQLLFSRRPMRSMPGQFVFAWIAEFQGIPEVDDPKKLT